ncbi:MAG: SDR family oxidoreductase [Candidatus Bathyarchaeia archaeon]
MAQLTDKIALVTGGGRGLGRAIALAFAGAGAHVAVASRTLEQLDEEAQEIRSRNRRGVAIEVDVTDSKSVAQMVETVRKEFGRIDILVNSAGVGWASRVVDTDDDVWKVLIDTNLTGTFYCCRDVARLMIEQKTGSMHHQPGFGRRSQGSTRTRSIRSQQGRSDHADAGTLTRNRETQRTCERDRTGLLPHGHECCHTRRSRDGA